MSENKWLGRIPASEYHADPAAVPSLSASMAGTLVNDCAARAYHLHPRLGGAVRGDVSDEMDEGTLVHAVLLGTLDQGQISIVDAPDWRTKAAQQTRDELRAAGKVPMLARKYERLIGACDRVREALAREGVDFGTMLTENAALWVARSTTGAAVQCRSMIDAFDPSAGVVWDLKTTDSAHPRAFRASAERYGYDIQAHAYRLAVAACMPDFAGRVGFRWACVEVRAPYVVAVYEPSGAMRELGRVKWEQAVDTWERCLRTDRWPGYVDGVGVIDASPWSIADALTIGGDSAIV